MREGERERERGDNSRYMKKTWLFPTKKELSGNSTENIFMHVNIKGIVDAYSLL